MDWSNRLTAKLIECYANYPCLFDTTSNLYKNKHARKDAIFKICECMKKSDAETITIEDVKKKITNIRSQFTHEHNKVKESKRSGAGTEDLYEPTVWWYEKLLFLIPYIKARKGESSLALKMQDTGDTQPDLSIQEFMNSNEIENDVYESEATPSMASSNLKKRKFANNHQEELQSNETDKMFKKTVETLESLQHNLKTPMPEVNEFQLYGQCLAQGLSEIDDLEIVNEARFEIDTIMYNARKKWFEKKKSDVM